MNIIAAVSENWGIGRGNDLLFHIPEDMKFFRKMTKDKTVILGRKNLESFPGGKPLKGRRHLLLTTNRDYEAEGVEIFHNVQDILREAGKLSPDDVWVIGGGMIYEEFLPYCEKAYITKVQAAVPADVFFPDLDADPGWVLTEQGGEMTEGDLSYCFCVYARVKNKG